MNAAPRLVLVAWITFVLGVVDVVRCIPEALTVWGQMNLVYFGVLCSDFAAAILALIAGSGLRKQRQWAWEPAAVCWGVLSGNSAVLLMKVLPAFVREIGRGYDWLIFAPRIIFYSASLLLLPYVLRVLWTEPPEGRPTNRQLFGWISLGAVAGAGIAEVLLSLPK